MDQVPNEMPLPPDFLPDPLPDPPVTARDASTVVLLRDTGDGPEAFLLRRVDQMAFAGGSTVFPGGGVDRRDADLADNGVAWAGPDAGWWAQRLGCDRSLAVALVCAAVRETFEECGVLLAGESADTVVSAADHYADARAKLVDRELSLAEFLAAEHLVLRSDLLRPWSNWVTPEAEPRRYDARFFVAALPEGQRADGNTSEALRAAWQRPRDAIADFTAGRSVLLPPTWTTLAELAEFPKVADVMAQQRPVEKLIPKVIRENGGLRLVLPGSPRYATAASHLDALPGDGLAR